MLLCFLCIVQFSRYIFGLPKLSSIKTCRLHPSPSKKGLVGSNGLEPSTSRLSGARSNRLSYEPSCGCRISSSRPGPFRGRGGDEGIRTLDPLRARQVLSQLSYTPVFLRASRYSSYFSAYENAVAPSKLNNVSKLAADLRTLHQPFSADVVSLERR